MGQLCYQRGAGGLGDQLDGGQELLKKKKKEALYSFAPQETEFQEVSPEPCSPILLQLVPGVVLGGGWVPGGGVLGGCWMGAGWVLGGFDGMQV